MTFELRSPLFAHLSCLPMCIPAALVILFFFHDTATTEIYTLSLHDALPILSRICILTKRILPTCGQRAFLKRISWTICGPSALRSEEHTSELQSRFDLVCRLLLEKKKMHS